MTIHPRPFLGSLQPTLGSKLYLAFLLMATKTRKRKAPSPWRKVVSANVIQGMDREFPASPNKPRSLSKKSGVAFSTVQRVVNGTSGASVDILADLAAALRMAPHNLLELRAELSPPYGGKPFLARRRAKQALDERRKPSDAEG